LPYPLITFALHYFTFLHYLFVILFIITWVGLWASGTRLNIEYKIPNAHICNEGVCFKTTFILVKNITSKIILGNPFLALLDPFIKTEECISTEIMGKKILFKFILPPLTKDIIMLKNIFIFQDINVICKQIRNRKNHVIQLPHESNFNEKTIPTNARPIQMNQELLPKGLLRKSKSSWSCSVFYVQESVELERGTPRLVINYKPLNGALKWIIYPILNKKDLLSRIYNATILSKFDMKSGFSQIQIDEKDKYKIAFTVHFRHYE